MFTPSEHKYFINTFWCVWLQLAVVAAHEQVLLDGFMAVLHLQNQVLNYLKLQKPSW